MENDKYIVWKRGDVDFDSDTRVYAIDAWPLDDAIVIRRQDIFAGPGLFAYANAIQTAIDLMVVSKPEWSDEDYQSVKRMGDLRDFFWEQAMMAKDSPVKKVPD